MFVLLYEADATAFVWKAKYVYGKGEWAATNFQLTICPAFQ